MVLQLKLQLLDVEPPIWRRILVDDAGSLHELHRMIQILMGWWDYHLYEFEVNGRRYHGPGDEPEFIGEDFGEDASLVTLRSLGLKKGAVFGYEYDFGDSWRMAILVERRRQTGGSWTLPWLLDGERAGPPEDCGGVDGFEDILAALEPVPAGSGDGGGNGVAQDGGGALADIADWDEFDDDETEEHERRQLLEWLGDYDPAQFNRRTVNHFLVLAGAWGALGR